MIYIVICPNVGVLVLYCLPVDLLSFATWFIVPNPLHCWFTLTWQMIMHRFQAPFKPEILQINCIESVILFMLEIGRIDPIQRCGISTGIKCIFIYVINKRDLRREIPGNIYDIYIKILDDICGTVERHQISKERSFFSSSLLKEKLSLKFIGAIDTTTIE